MAFQDGLQQLLQSLLEVEAHHVESLAMLEAQPGDCEVVVRLVHQTPGSFNRTCHR